MARRFALLGAVCATCAGLSAVPASPPAPVLAGAAAPADPHVLVTAANPAAPELSVTEARDALVALVAEREGSDRLPRDGDDDGGRSALISAMDAVLRANTATYETRAFVEFALNGEWVLEATTRKRDGARDAELEEERGVRLAAVRQSLRFDRGAATLTNAFDWVSGCGKTGVLEATCAVELAASATRTNGWTLSFGETVHALKPDGKMPPGADVPALVDAIARLAPFELFDPHGTHLDLAYADPELRIMGVGLGSKRGANNLHLLSRLDGPWGLNKAADDDDDDD